MAHQPDPLVDRALHIAGSGVSFAGEGRWNLSFVNGAVVPAHARLSDGWLELSAPLPSSSASTDPLRWLELNADLEGSARFARRLRDPILRVVADVDMTPPACGFDLVVSACGHMADALHTERGGLPVVPPLMGGRARRSAAELGRACRETGWPCVVNDDGTRVELATRAGVHNVTFESSAAGGDRAIVELGDLSAFTPASAQAAAVLLLAASGTVRSVKGAVRTRDGVTTALLIAPVDAPLDSAGDEAIDRALSGLATACHMCAREVRALKDERLATAYLSIWNTSQQQPSPQATEEEPCQQQR